MLEKEVLKNQIGNTLDDTDFQGLGEKYEGKVRDCYIREDQRILIVTDRVSAFDRVLTSIPFKGQVLNQIANFWFEQTKDIVPNHVVSVPDPNVTVAREADAFPVEIIVRGYITGVTKTSAWYNYEQGVRDFCGNRLPEGLKKDQKFDKPIITPTTKAVKGEHDESISADEIVERGLLTRAQLDKVSEIALKLFARGIEIVADQGIILVDTKYEFGFIDGEIVLIDEAHTPDSSRFWFADTYNVRFEKGDEQRKIDKEYIRSWLADQGFLGDGPIPAIPDDVKVEAAGRYIQAYELITGQDLVVNPSENVHERIQKNLSGLLI